MKVCPLCGETFAPFVDFCFADGEVLTLEQAALDVPEPEGFDAPPPPKMLQGSQQRASYTRSATPVPRARRPGRSLIQRSENQVYTAPDAVEIDEIDPKIAALSPPEPDQEEIPEVEIDVEVEDPEAVLEPPENADPEILEADDASTPAPAADEAGVRTPAPLPPASKVKVPPPVDFRPMGSQTGPVEDRESRAAGLWLVAMGAVVVGAIVIAIGLLIANSVLNPSDPGDTVVTAQPTPPIPTLPPTPVPKEPVPVEPTDSDVPGPEPIVPGPVAPGDPATPEPVVPDPVVPDPVVPDPVVPDPVVPDPSDAVAIVTPEPKNMSKILVESIPSQALIYFNGEALGTTPMTLNHEYGLLRIRLEKDGFLTLDKRLQISQPTHQTGVLTMIRTSAPDPEPAEPDPAPVDPVPAQPDPAPAEPEPVTDGPPRSVFLFLAGAPNGTTVEMAGQRATFPARLPSPVALGAYNALVIFPDGRTLSKSVRVTAGAGMCTIRLHVDGQAICHVR